MRELKFRAWYNNKMWEVNSVEWVEYDDHPAGAYLFGLEGWVIVADKYMKPNSGVAILMQYTGLKDRDGVEIYEGDIIESGVSKELSLKGHRGYVVFEDASFTVERRQHKVPYNHDKYLPYLDWPCEAFESCKVIGNVFEDGELLKE